MSPVNTSASSTDVDNEATAELPVLDVAAYESTLNDISHTDTWVIPASAAPVVTSEATAQVPTLQPYDLDHSGTHEMPSLPPRKEPKPAKSAKHAKGAAPAAAPTLAPAAVIPAAVAPPALPPAGGAPLAPATPASTGTSAKLALPPSPPLIEDLRNALAAAERRIEELNERFRIADAERAVAIARAQAETTQLREQLGVHLEALQTARERLDVQRADEPELQNELFLRFDRISVLERELAAQGKVLEAKLSALGTSEKHRESLEVDLANLRAACARRDSQIAMLEADLQSRQHREAAINARLSEALASVAPNVPQMREELAARDEQIQRLTTELAHAKAAATEKNEDLQVAEENIRQLENDLRDKSGKLEEASVTVEEWRAVIAESQRSILQRDGRIRELEADLERRATAVAHATDQTGEEVALEGPARVLIRTDGNTDFVHVLGRRTRIGRGSDNELVLDTKHVSRYHAVVLAGPVHTSIEDLNSTNGVFVNGKRVARQVLKDGDRVAVGKTTFRYTVRD